MEKYVQICPECGTKYFMDDPSQRKIVCDECGKRSIRGFVPLPVQDVKEDPGVKKYPLEEMYPREEKYPRVIKDPGVKKDPIKNTEPEEPGKGAGSSEGEKTKWKELLDEHRKKIQQDQEPDTPKEDRVAKEQKPAVTQTGRVLLKVSGRQGRAELRLDDSKGPVFIGQYWVQGQFFAQDARVSRTHCVLFRMADGKWYVRDAHSSNGTFLQERPGAPVTKVSADEPAGIVKGSIIMLGPWDDAVRMEVTEA